MDDLSTGTLVRHATLGLGRVVALEPNAVHVFFPAAESRFAAKLRLPDARRLLRREAAGNDPWLEGLTPFSLDAETRRYALAASWITHDQAVAQFTAAYPGGFSGEAYLAPGGRAAAWRAAAAEMEGAFGDGAAAALLADGDHRALVERALRVLGKAAAAGTVDLDEVEAALADAETALPFFEAVLAVLSVPSPARARFERLFAAAGALGDSAVAWPLATALPFVASPAKQVFLSPRIASAAADRLGFDLRLDAAPGWSAYAALRTFSDGLLERLRPLGARDLVDVEAFLHAIATRRAGSTAGRSRATRPSAARSKPAR
ncbi:conserved hypothetical protein [Anaeromyxobacter dehalogenans 2CP-1]|uniref:Uncharacterized protein n=1 Tax=Anaeromyxobacter dehalogenans (strain ATCC BAA-258 / DSM 21875 / 2CP-1) TaxID=455488 RepID=B8JF31_ANAD2|nr:hypothetical protein [Anaeromyxobacter dehalogenans]ACL64388.1 conserved hypothetical protein [Anaeromyxobacter dehalogenans 2CP-1]